MDKLYKIVELGTMGWETVGSQYRKLTREQAKDFIFSLIEEGYNPNYLRAVPDND